MPARTIRPVSIGGICALALPGAGRGHQRAAACHSDKQADAESRSDIKRIDHAHTICSNIRGYLMAPQFLPQCTVRNKNVSAARKAWVVNLPTSYMSNGI